MKTTCLNCNETTELTFPVEWVEFACPHCHTHFKKDEAGNHQRIKFFPAPQEAMTFHIGQQGVLDGVLWEVGGLYIKQVEDGPWAWREYTLYNAAGDVCFLSEYDGHWVLAREITTGEKFAFNESFGQQYRGERYPIYNDTKFHTGYAAGFFLHPVVEKGQARDYVRAPFALLLEKEGRKTYAFDARHVSADELKRGFPDVEWPERSGIGMLQPFAIDTPVLYGVMGAVGVLIVLLHFTLQGFFPSYQVLEDYVMLPDTAASVTHVTPSFTSTGRRAPLQIDFSAPVDNSWAGVDLCLVNEDTKEERYGSIEVAYYYGYDEGESWSEGSKNPTIKICDVPPGRYHLRFEVTKQPDRPDLRSLRYTVFARSATYNNLFLALGLLGVAALAAYLGEAHFEKQRWMNSDFPPESEDE